MHGELGIAQLRLNEITDPRTKPHIARPKRTQLLKICMCLLTVLKRVFVKRGPFQYEFPSRARAIEQNVTINTAFTQHPIGMLLTVLLHFFVYTAQQCVNG